MIGLHTKRNDNKGKDWDVFIHSFFSPDTGHWSLATGLFFVFLSLATCHWSLASAHAEEGPVKSWFKSHITVYEPPPVEMSTSPVFRTVDPQIIQKLIDLLDEKSLGKEETGTDNPTINDLNSLVTPEGLEIKNRYTRLGVALSESLGWEPIKHVRVISEQNLKQRLTTVARWDSTPNVRSIALIALASLKDKNDLVYFQEALWSRNIGIRYATIEALLKWGYADDAVPMLHDLIDKDESLLIRVVAASALARFDYAQGSAELRKNFDSKDWFVRALSAKALGEVGTDEDYDFLADQVDKEHTTNTNDFALSEISIAALKLFPLKIEKERQLREMKKNKSAVAPPAAKPAPKKKRNDVLFELEPIVVKVPRLSIPQEEPVDPRIDFQLLKMLQDNVDERITDVMANQSAAYKDLNQLVTPGGIRLKARYTVLGFLLAEGLAGTRDFQIISELTRIVRGERTVQDPRVKSFALIALSYGKDRNDLYLFQDALRNGAVDERFAAIEALQIWGLPEASGILLGETKLDSSAFLKVYAAQAAFRLGEPIGKDYLLQAFDDPDWVARAMAMRYIGELGGAEDYNRVISYLMSQQKEIVQAEMCSALLRLYAKKYEQLEKERAEEGESK